MIESHWSEYGGWRWDTQSHGPPVGTPFTAIVHGDSTRATLSVSSEWIDTAGKEVKCSTTSSWKDQQTEAAIKTEAERR
jgi:hypothetical protein